MPLVVFMIAATMLIGLPLAGVAAAGLEVAGFLEFPPLTRYVQHAKFSWPIFISIALADLLLVAALVFLILKNDQRKVKKPLPALSYFPWWGWAGVATSIVGTILAWSRFEWFALFQQHTFTIPWIGYIIVVNALCVKRKSSCALTNNPRGFILLFPLSTVFWWFFEYLNRYVQNWYYLGIDNFGTIQYVFFASLSFSTVLPAVLSTYELIMTFPALNRGLSRSFVLNIYRPRFIASLTVALSGVGLALIGIYPDFLFPLLWISPLLIAASLQTLFGQENIFTPVRIGDWRNIAGPALAALICGFFWEMWNYYSLAKWEYAVPFVNRFHVFEMPALGFGGYLPFGLECLTCLKLFQVPLYQSVYE